MTTIAPRSTFLTERIWPIFRVIILQLLLISGIIGGPVAILVFTLLVDRLHWLDIDFHGKTTETISPDGLILVALVLFTVNLILVLFAWRFLERKHLGDMLFVFSGEHWRPVA